MRASVVVTTVAVAVVLGAATGGAAPASIAPQTDDVDPDGVVMRVDVNANGTATWTIAYRVRLDDENTTAAFENLSADIRENRTAFSRRFADRMERTVDAAQNATGREMTVRNVTVDTGRQALPQSYGIVAYEFTWTNFARTPGDRIVVGDAVSGLFLDRESRLVVTWPGSYEAVAVTPDADARDAESVTWVGPIEFAPDEPRLRLARERTATGGASDGAGTGGNGGGTGSDGGDGGGIPVGPLVVVALLVVGVAALARRRRSADAEPTGGGTGAGTEATGGTADADAATATGGDDEDDEDDGDDEPPEELLSPEERVLKYLREHGGRVKQQEIVGAFDWTDARTSQVVGSLREDGRVETFRLGRENVVKLPDEGEGEDEGDESGTGGDDEADDPTA